MATKLAYIPRYTAEDYEQWVEPNCELIQGIPYMMSPMPRLAHQRVSHRLGILLEEALEECPSCEVLPPVNYRIDDETILQLDNLVVCTDEPLEEGLYLTATPALIFEILSPPDQVRGRLSTALKDRLVKREIYEAAGVRHYVIVDPEREEAEVLTLEGERYERRFTGRDSRVAFDLGVCTFELDVARLWRR